MQRLFLNLKTMETKTTDEMTTMTNEWVLLKKGSVNYIENNKIYTVEIISASERLENKAKYTIFKFADNPEQFNKLFTTYKNIEGYLSKRDFLEVLENKTLESDIKEYDGRYIKFV